MNAMLIQAAVAATKVTIMQLQILVADVASNIN